MYLLEDKQKSKLEEVMKGIKYYDLHMFPFAFRIFLHCSKHIMSEFFGFATRILGEAKKKGKFHTRSELLLLQMLATADT